MVLDLQSMVPADTTRNVKMLYAEFEQGTHTCLVAGIYCTAAKQHHLPELSMTSTSEL
jgi:hypothetical protein